MSFVCLKCGSQAYLQVVPEHTFHCPKCDEVLTRNEVYRVSKHAFGKGNPEARVAAAKARRKKLHGLRLKQQRHERRKNRRT